MNSLLHVVGTCAAVAAIVAGAEFAVDTTARKVVPSERQGPTASAPNWQRGGSGFYAESLLDSGAGSSSDTIIAPQPGTPPAATDAAKGQISELETPDAGARGFSALGPSNWSENATVAVAETDDVDSSQATLARQDSEALDPLATSSIEPRAVSAQLVTSDTPSPARSNREAFEDLTIAAPQPAEITPPPTTAVQAPTNSGRVRPFYTRDVASSQERVTTGSSRAGTVAKLPIAAKPRPMAAHAAATLGSKPGSVRLATTQPRGRSQAKHDTREVWSVGAGPATYNYAVSSDSCHSSGSFFNR